MVQEINIAVNMIVDLNVKSYMEDNLISFWFWLWANSQEGLLYFQLDMVIVSHSGK